MKRYNWQQTVRYALALLFTLHYALLTASAQSEAGLMMEVGAEKKLSKKVSIGLDAELRTRNNLKTLDRWSLGVGAEYKVLKNVKLAAGYLLLNDNFRESISYKADGNYNNWRPSYWGIRHRLYASATGSLKLNKNLRLSLRERWQYTYRPEKTVSRWDFDNSCWENKVREVKAKNQLRSRLQVDYEKKHALLAPYASVELYNAWAVEKVRYTLGTNVNLAKQHTLNLYYRFQDLRNVAADEYDPDMHYIGAGYKFKF